MVCMILTTEVKIFFASSLPLVLFAETLVVDDAAVLSPDCVSPSWLSCKALSSFSSSLSLSCLLRLHQPRTHCTTGVSIIQTNPIFINMLCIHCISAGGGCNPDFGGGCPWPWPWPLLPLLWLFCPWFDPWFKVEPLGCEVIVLVTTDVDIICTSTLGESAGVSPSSCPWCPWVIGCGMVTVVPPGSSHYVKIR